MWDRRRGTCCPLTRLSQEDMLPCKQSLLCQAGALSPCMMYTRWVGQSMCRNCLSSQCSWRPSSQSLRLGRSQGTGSCRRESWVPLISKYRRWWLTGSMWHMVRDMFGMTMRFHSGTQCLRGTCSRRCFHSGSFRGSTWCIWFLHLRTRRSLHHSVCTRSQRHNNPRGT